MTTFIQLHYLTIYPPSNPNRDDLGRPKSATYGGAPRLRISSQSLKRAARTSHSMQEALQGSLGARTRRIGEEIRTALQAQGADDEKATMLASKLADIFGKLDTEEEKKGNIRIRQLAFVSPDERKHAIKLAVKALAGEALPDVKELKKLVLRRADGAADVAMFGRMLADDPEYNREAAVQVSHALTTHRAIVEDDYYTAIDDLKTPAEDAGAGFVGDAGFGSGVYYLYACIDADLLLENLSGDGGLAAKSAEALTEALATATPSGKRNAFAHHTYATYLRAEVGDRQPRSLAGAFFSPVEGNLVEESIRALKEMAEKMDRAYGPCTTRIVEMNLNADEGSLADVKQFVRSSVETAANAI